jgi:hypothetical protein
MASLLKLKRYLQSVSLETEGTIYVDLIVMTNDKMIKLKCGRYKPFNNRLMTFIQQDHWDPVNQVWLYAKQRKSDVAAINFVTFFEDEFEKLYHFLDTHYNKTNK